MAAIRIALFLALAALYVYGASAWGKEGHRLTCMVAEPFLSEEAKRAIEELLPGRDFVALCSWADDVRRSYRFRWSGPLHYIDTPDGLCTYDYDRDCHDSHNEMDMCVAGAINNYTSQLESYNTEYNLTEALLFLAHYVGDIHQPLHVGFTTDAGGNSVHVHWFGRKYNLHHIWDTEFITRANREYYHTINKMSQNLTRSITKKDRKDWTCEDDQATCTDRYATESIRLACKWAYKDASDDAYLEDDYFLTRLPIVEQRLTQGGFRLASILNRIFSKEVATY